MPWCPNCNEEYIESIETCPECGVKLVDEEPELESEPELIPGDEDYVYYDDKQLDNEILLIEAQDEIEFGFYINVLKANSIDYRVTLGSERDVLEAYVGRDIHLKNIYVMNVDYERAVRVCKEAASNIQFNTLPEDEFEK